MADTAGSHASFERSILEDNPAGDRRPSSSGNAAAVAAKQKPGALKSRSSSGRIKVDESAAASSMSPAELREELAAKAHRVTTLEQELRTAKDKQAELMRSGAKRLIQIAMLERQLESEQTRNQTMVEELVKQTQMMDRVLNFRDQECARDTTELLHENAELKQQLDVWKERAQTLQQERWGFVQKFRTAKAGGADAAGAAVEDSSSEEEEDEGERDDDW